MQGDGFRAALFLSLMTAYNRGSCFTFIWQREKTKAKTKTLFWGHFEKETVSPSEAQLGPQLETQLSQNKKVGPPLLQSSLDQPLASQGEGKELEPPSGLTSHPPTLS